MVYRCQLLYQPFGEVHSFVYQSFTFFLTSVHLEHSSNSIPNITIAQPSWNLPFSPCDPNIFHDTRGVRPVWLGERPEEGSTTLVDVSWRAGSSTYYSA